MSLKKFVPWCVLGSLAFSAVPAWAENSSPSSTGSDTTGFNLSPTLTLPPFEPGRVETHVIEANASGGLILSPGGGKSVRANARVPLHFWGSYDPSYRRGLLLDPGTNLRLDWVNGERVRTTVEVSGAALYRWQGTDAHFTQNDIDDWNSALKAFRPKLDAIRADYQNELSAELSRIYHNDFNDNDVRSMMERLDPKYRKRIEDAIHSDPALYQLVTRYRDSSDWKYRTCDTGTSPEDCAPQTLDYAASEVLDSMRCYPAGDNKVTCASSSEVYQRLARAAPPKKSEPSATGDVTLGHVGYRYNDDKRAGIREDGFTISPLELTGHAAIRSGSTNIGFSGSLNPVQFITGDTRRVGHQSTRAKACVDVTVGELPTLKQCGDVVEYWGHSGKQSGHAVSSTTTVEKKLGPVTPYASLVLEHESTKSGGAAPNTAMLYVGAEGF